MEEFLNAYQVITGVQYLENVFLWDQTAVFQLNNPDYSNKQKQRSPNRRLFLIIDDA
ncbi:hypothetical protein CHRYSEOSP005_18050 [Chryseobacterium sp. Alg-005]